MRRIVKALLPVLWIRIHIDFCRLGMRIRIQVGRNDPENKNGEEMNCLEVRALNIKLT
jgi:hypothetical protein